MNSVLRKGTHGPHSLWWGKGTGDHGNSTNSISSKPGRFHEAPRRGKGGRGRGLTFLLEQKEMRQIEISPKLSPKGLRAQANGKKKDSVREGEGKG